MSIFEDFSPSDLDQVLDDVRWGRLTPLKAEEWCAKAGVALRPEPQQFDPLDLRRWTILMALAWIVHRDVGPVREHWDAFRERDIVWLSTGNGGHYLERRGRATRRSFQVDAAKRGVGDTNSAERELLHNLAIGKLSAFGVPIGRRTGRDIAAAEFEFLQVADGDDRDGVSLRADADGMQGYRSVRIPMTEILSLWPSPFATARPIPAPPREKGRPRSVLRGPTLAQFRRLSGKDEVESTLAAQSRVLVKWQTDNYPSLRPMAARYITSLIRDAYRQHFEVQKKG